MMRAHSVTSSTAAVRMTSPVGVVAEDETDYKAIRVIIKRVAGNSVGTRKRIGNGCSRIRAKAGVWLNQLAEEGCAHAIVLHDLDRNPLNQALNDEATLRADLHKACQGSSIRHLICIPIEELEAWFWSDPGVVKHVGRGTGAASASPHKVVSPKEELMRLSRGANKKPRYSTNDNEELAEMLDISLCRSRCISFDQLVGFLERTFGT
jgi:hypothetical protein